MIKQGRKRLLNPPLISKRTATKLLPTMRAAIVGSAGISRMKLHPMVLEESYAIGREAFINALNHAEDLHIEVEITYDPRQVHLRVRDGGRSIDSEILEEGGHPNHWGLRGMRERAQRIGAQLEL